MIQSIGNWKRTHYTREISSDMDNDTVIVMGWAREIRDIGKLKFVKLADRDGFLQVTVKDGNVKPEVVKKVKALNREDVIAVKGTVKSNKEAPNGFEIIPQDIRILNKSEKQLLLDVAGKTPAELPTRLNARFLDLRRPEIHAIFKVEDLVFTAMRIFFEGNGFIEIHTPKIVSEATEGGANFFEIKYFDRSAYLAQSPQFYKQIMMSSGFDKVYEIAPTFRAEKHHTIRHVCEITMADFEMSFVSTQEELMDILEEMIVSVYEYVKKHGKKELGILGKKIEVPKRPFPRITMEEAYKIMKNAKIPYKEDEELSTAGEKALGKHVQEKLKHDFVFLRDFPWSDAKFYHMRGEKNTKIAERCDLICSGIEIATISLREHRYDILVKQAKEKGMDIKKLKFFLESFKYGTPPHGGAGIGPERIVMQMLNLPNIRETVFFPREPDRVVP